MEKDNTSPCPAPPQSGPSADSIVSDLWWCAVQDLESGKCQLEDCSSSQYHHTWFKKSEPEADLSYIFEEEPQFGIRATRSSLYIQSLYTHREPGFMASTAWIYDSGMEGEEDILIAWDS